MPSWPGLGSGLWTEVVQLRSEGPSVSVFFLSIYCVPVSSMVAGTIAQRHTVPLRSGRSLSNDLFTRVPSKNRKEERHGTGRGGSQPRVLSQKGPVERNFGSVLQGHLDT